MTWNIPFVKRRGLAWSSSARLRRWAVTSGPTGRRAVPPQGGKQFDLFANTGHRLMEGGLRRLVGAVLELPMGGTTMRTALLLTTFVQGLGTEAGCLGATVKAAPILWGLGKEPSEEPVLARKLDRFVLRHAWRTLFQLGGFVAPLWALI